MYRSLDGRWSIERLVDRYIVCREQDGDAEEAWSCPTLAELYAWLAERGLSVADFDEVA